jgi:hypothetical protein
MISPNSEAVDLLHDYPHDIYTLFWTKCMSPLLFAVLFLDVLKLVPLETQALIRPLVTGAENEQHWCSACKS